MIDWAGCELLERVPGKRSGEPLIKGTRIPPEAILVNYEAGMSLDDLVENYPSAGREVIEKLLEYIGSRRGRQAA